MGKIMTTASIVTYKTDKEELTTVLKCVANSSIEKIYIVDNSPEDELRKFENLSPKIEYIFGHHNVGYGAAHNIAIRKAIENGAQYHVVINPDIQFENGAIEALTTYMNENPDVGQVMPRVVYPNGELQYLCKLLPTPMDLMGRRFIPIDSYVDKRNHKFEMRDSGYDKIIQVPFLSGCFMFLRVEALQLVGGFSDRYWMYCEDLDLCRRIAESYQTMYLPSVTIIHAHKKESFKSKRMLKAHVKSAIKYFNHWGWFFDKNRDKINKATKRQYQRPK
ncbi:MAG: glycosyltransferase family 2 protein [Mucinivorans sp.]